MLEIPCFLLTPTNRDALYLRRYKSGKECPLPYGYHNAQVRVEDAPTSSHHNFLHYQDDPRWPTACECGYVFTDSDIKQLFPLTIYQDAAGGEFTVHDSPPQGITKAPPGAMWFLDWCPGPKKHSGPYLWVMLPDGFAWCVDGASSDRENGRGPGWTRTGEPPLVTVTPSILTPKYHGFLRNGMLVPV